MRSYSLGILATLLTGCANTGAFISSGSINYGVLMDSLGCEVKSVFDRGSLPGGKLTPAESWKANVTVVIEGNLNRSGGLVGSVSALPVLRGNSLSASIEGKREFDDTGTVGLKMDWSPTTPQVDCHGPDFKRYDLSSIGLSSWYAGIEHSAGNGTANSYIGTLEFKRIVKFTHLKGSVSVKLFNPGTLTPSLSLTSGEVATIKIVFVEIPKPSPVKPQLVALDQATLNALADILGGKQLPKKGGKRKLAASLPVAPNTLFVAPTADEQLRRELDDRNTIRLLRESDAFQ